MASKIGRWARKALGWIGKAVKWFNLIPPGLIDPKAHAKLTKAITKMLNILAKAESTVGAHTVFWPTLSRAPVGTVIIFRYPKGTEKELHPDTVAYLKLFKKGFDEVKKLK